MFLNPLTQVGDRRTAFEIPFRGRVSYVSILISRETAIGSKQRKAVTSIAGCIAIIDLTKEKVNFDRMLFTGPVRIVLNQIDPVKLSSFLRLFFLRQTRFLRLILQLLVNQMEVPERKVSNDAAHKERN